MRAVCISESYCQYKTDTGYCGYTGMGCAQSLVRSVKYDPKVSLVHQVELTDDCIDKIAEAVAKKLRYGAKYCPGCGATLDGVVDGQSGK